MRAVISASVEDLSCVCDEIARAIKSAESSKIAESSAIFLFNGDIGAGKTTLVKAFARYVGIKESVTSPTFSLLHIYNAESTLFGGLESSELERDSSFCESKKKQKLLNNLCEAPLNSPASWCKKSESKGAEVPPADFLLEAEKRGSPPKSEKRQLLGNSFKNSWGERGGGAALLREETSEISGNGIAEFTLDFADSQNLKIYHYDLYQKGVDSALDLGLLDLLGECGIHFVEWGDERLFNIIKNAFENIFIIQITKAKNDRIYEFKSEF